MLAHSVQIIWLIFASYVPLCFVLALARLYLPLTKAYRGQYRYFLYRFFFTDQFCILFHFIIWTFIFILVHVHFRRKFWFDVTSHDAAKQTRSFESVHQAFTWHPKYPNKLTIPHFICISANWFYTLITTVKRIRCDLV